MAPWRHLKSKHRWLGALVAITLAALLLLSAHGDVARFYYATKFAGTDARSPLKLVVKHSDTREGEQHQSPQPQARGAKESQPAAAAVPHSTAHPPPAGATVSGGASEPVCQVPRLNKDDPSVAKFFGTAKPLQCDKVEKDWLMVDGGKLVFDAAASARHGGSVDCAYSPFWRVSDDRTQSKLVKSVQNGTVMETDFCQVSCTGADGASWRRSFATAAVSAERVAALRKAAEAHRAKSPNALDLNVYILGFDSISHMTFVRKFPKTYKLLTEELGSVPLDGYNIVGDGTPQAFIPILTGQTEVELPLTRKRYKNATYVNVYPFLWKEFAARGYATLYGEDSARVGTFTYRLKGFKEQPTDHYFRTFFQVHENDESKHHKWACLGSVPLHTEYLRYGLDFFDNYPRDVRKFALLHYSELTHDNLDTPQLVDGDAAEHIRSLKRAGHLDDTMLIVMADHGHRFDKLRATQQGQLEERLPFFSVYMPTKFRQEHKAQWDNLVANAKNRLTTPFDIYPTLKAIYDWPGIEANAPSERSNSLWAPISLERTCKMAGVDDHWCTCLNWDTLPADDEHVRTVAAAVVQAINDETEAERRYCLPLKLKEIVSARGLAPNRAMLSYKKAKDYDGFVPDLSNTVGAVYSKFQLQVRTEPGGGLFEATVELDNVSNSVLVDLAAVSRINAYGDAPKCIIDRNYFLAKWCVCPGWQGE